MSYFQLFVPSIETTCYSWFLKQSILNLSPIFITGVTGTGKTIIISKTLEKMKNEGVISTLMNTFSAKTGALATQN